VAEGKIEEETYSLILTALKHPLRRKIIRMLSNKPLSFSEILESLAIDSGHLNYHIKNLGDIVTRIKDGKYALSSIGLAAVELVSKVEEQDTLTKRTKRINKLAVIFSVIFAVALLTATVYALTFTTQEQIDLFKADQETEGIPIRIQLGQAFSYNITINQVIGSYYGYSIRQQQTSVDIPQTRNDVYKWTRCFSDTLLQCNGTFDILIAIYDPYGNTVNSWREGGITISTDIPLSFEFIKFGTYTLQIENLSGEEFKSVLVPQGIYIVYERPLFNYGIVGLIILLLYPVLFVLSWNWTKKLQSRQTQQPILK